MVRVCAPVIILRRARYAYVYSNKTDNKIAQKLLQIITNVKPQCKNIITMSFVHSESVCARVRVCFLHVVAKGRLPAHSVPGFSLSLFFPPFALCLVAAWSRCRMAPMGCGWLQDTLLIQMRPNFLSRYVKLYTALKIKYVIAFCF